MESKLFFLYLIIDNFNFNFIIFFIFILNRNFQCGMLHCDHKNERLEFGMENVSTLSQKFINNNGSLAACRTVIVDLGLNEVDPGLTPDGAKCGENKVCVSIVNTIFLNYL
jgi:hypothetical protein